MKTAKPANVERLLDVARVLKTKSVFLFGPRQCGKSWLVGHTVKGAHLLDLLSSETFIRLTQHPEYIEEIGADGKPIVIDEIQKLPQLLDEVHRLIERRGFRFPRRSISSWGRRPSRSRAPA